MIRWLRLDVQPGHCLLLPTWLLLHRLCSNLHSASAGSAWLRTWSHRKVMSPSASDDCCHGQATRMAKTLLTTTSHSI